MENKSKYNKKLKENNNLKKIRINNIKVITLMLMKLLSQEPKINFIMKNKQKLKIMVMISDFNLMKVISLWL